MSEKLGAVISNHSLIEILPLPCPKVSDWNYSSWVNLDELNFMNTKTRYKREIIDLRTNFIKSKINQATQKKLIIFLANGKEKIEYWNKISPIPINNYNNLIGNIPYHIDNNKMYVNFPFPGSKSSNGVFNSDTEIINIGNLVKSIFDRL